MQDSGLIQTARTLGQRNRMTNQVSKMVLAHFDSISAADIRSMPPYTRNTSWVSHESVEIQTYPCCAAPQHKIVIEQDGDCPSCPTHGTECVVLLRILLDLLVYLNTNTAIRNTPSPPAAIDWEGLLEQLSEEKPEEVAWRIRTAQGNQITPMEMMCRGKRGKLVIAGVRSPKLSDKDQVTKDLIDKVRWYHLSIKEVPTILEIARRTTLLYLNPDQKEDRELRVRKESMTIRAVEHGTDQVEFQILVEGQPYGHKNGKVWSVPEIEVRLHRETDELVLWVLPDPLQKFINLTKQTAGFLPLSHLHTAVRTLAAQQIACEVPEHLRGVEVDTDPTIHLTVELDGDTLYLTPYVDPIPGGVRHTPAEGLEEVQGVLNGGMCWGIRDMQTEHDTLSSLKTLLDPYTPVTQGGVALSYLEKLKDPIQGIQTHWITKKKKVVTPTEQDLRCSVRSEGTNWFSVEGSVLVEGQRLPVERILQALREGRTSIETHTSVVQIEGSLRRHLEMMRNLEMKGGKIMANSAHAALLNQLPITEQPDASWTEARDRFVAAQTAQWEQPIELTATLRDYQREGVCWLHKLASWAPGCVLADEMGLGKTLQAIAILCERKDAGPQFVVAPVSLRKNWERELSKFAPSLRFIDLADQKDLSGLGPSDVLWGSWDRMVRRIDDLAGIQFNTVVMDEAQAAKNPTTKRSKAAVQLKAGFRLSLTGTPLENHLGELWSLMRFTVPGLLGSWDHFTSNLEDNIDLLRKLIKPFMLRRLKGEVAKDLPEKQEINLLVSLSTEEQALYLATQEAIRIHIDTLPPPNRRFALLAGISRLRQIACNPELIEDFKGKSSKIEMLREKLEELREAGHSALVFSQYVRNLQRIKEILTKEGYRVSYLDGQMNQNERAAEVDRFQRGETDVFLISLRAGGVGLNLTRASYVFHLDPWWNPAVEDQATDRAHRIGQTQAVTVYRMIAQPSIEEKVLALHESKRDLSAELLEGSDLPSTLTLEELEDLLAL